MPPFAATQYIAVCNTLCTIPTSTGDPRRESKRRAPVYMLFMCLLISCAVYLLVFIIGHIVLLVAVLLVAFVHYPVVSTYCRSWFYVFNAEHLCTS